jgi:hypothetical protein
MHFGVSSSPGLLRARSRRTPNGTRCAPPPVPIVTRPHLRKETPPRACGDTANGSGSARNCTSSSHRSTIAGVTASERRRTRKCGRGTVPRCCRAGEPQGELEGGRDAKSCRRSQVGTWYFLDILAARSIRWLQLLPLDATHIWFSLKQNGIVSEAGGMSLPLQPTYKLQPSYM